MSFFSSCPPKGKCYRLKRLALLAVSVAVCAQAQGTDSLVVARRMATDSTARQVRPILLREVQVYGQLRLTTPTAAQAAGELRRIAGSTSLVEMKPDVGRLSTLKEALRMQPGVIIQEFFGLNDQPRLNIRGSGIQSNPQRRGVYLLQDGIPVNFADGSYVIGVLDPMTAQYVEVLKGANALNFGASTLGGGINFVSATGTEDGRQGAARLKVEGGSYGFRSVAASAGKKWGRWDAHADASYSGQEGFRRYNRNDRVSLSVDIGNINERGTVEHRTYGAFTYLKFQFPGPLNLQQVMENPREVSAGVDLPFSMGPDVLRDRPRRRTRMWRLAHRSGVRLGPQSNVVLSAYYQSADDQFVFPITISIPHSLHNDGGVTLSYRLATGRHRIRGGVLASYGKIDRRTYINRDGRESLMFAHDDLRAKNLTLFAEEDLRLTRGVNVVADVHWVYNERNSRDVFPEGDLRPWFSQMTGKYRYFYSQNISLRQRWRAFNPRLGVVGTLDSRGEVRLFGNVSRSYEPPTFDELVGTEVGPNIHTSPKRLFAIELEKQTATTVEVGSTGRSGRWSWNVAGYCSWVQNELLEVKDYVRGIKRTENYPHTLHQGVEAGVNVTIFDRPWGWNAGRLTLGGVYNYSRFRFSGGRYAGKQLAGIPRHFATATADYEHPCGASVSASVEWKPGETPIDHTNTLFQPAYSVWNLRATYRLNAHLSFYAELKNVANRRYASSYIISDEIHHPPMPFPNFTARQMTFFIPGQPRCVFGGLTWKI